MELVVACKEVNLSKDGVPHLICADDLLVFLKGDVKSFLALEKIFLSFASYAGLYINKEECISFQ